LTFTRAGEALYLHSSSELQRISLSASKVTKAHCGLILPPNARSYPAEEAAATTSEEHEEIIVEGSAETEGETQSSQPVEEKEKKPITENGSVGSPTEGESTPKEAALRPAASTTDVNGEEERQDTSSIGDITIDSVKEHLLNNSALFKNNASAEDLQDRLAGLKLDITARTTETTKQNETVKQINKTVITATNGETTSHSEQHFDLREREISSGSETTTTHATITLPPNVEISAADLENLTITTTTITTEKVEKSQAPLARPEEVGS